MHEGYLVDASDLHTNIQQLPMKCTDESVNLNVVRKHLTYDGWTLLERTVSALRDLDQWVCRLCHVDLAGSVCLACDSCLEWFHLTCTGRTVRPKQTTWFYRECRAQSRDNV